MLFSHKRSSMLGRRSRIATLLTKQARITGGRLALGLGGGLAAAGAIGYHDVRRALAGMTPEQMAYRRAMGAKATFKPSYGYGALKTSLERM